MSAAATDIAPPPGRIALPLHKVWEVGPPVVLFVALAIANFVVQPALWSLTEVGLLLGTALPLMLVSLGQTLVILSRGFDLSVGGTFAIGSVLAATLVGSHSWGIVALLAIVLAAGTLNGLLVAYGRFAPFVVTFATWSIFNGIALQILDHDGGTVPQWLTTLVTGEAFGIPNPYIILAVSLLVWWHIRRSAFGRNMYAIGSDEERARLNGISVTRTKLGVYALSGLAAGIGGILLAGATATGQPIAGNAYILQSIAAVVIGGTLLSGGNGGYGLTVLGVLILTLISTLVQGLNLEAWVSVGASALLLLLVVGTRSMLNAHRPGRVR